MSDKLCYHWDLKVLLQPHGLWQNSVPFSCRIEVFVSLLAINQEALSATRTCQVFGGVCFLVCLFVLTHGPSHLQSHWWKISYIQPLFFKSFTSEKDQAFSRICLIKSNLFRIISLSKGQMIWFLITSAKSLHSSTQICVWLINCDYMCTYQSSWEST